MPKTRHKTQISLRLDDDVLEYFQKDGPGYQTRINRALREYMLTDTYARLVAKDVIEHLKREQDGQT